jgi:ABC-2 type transport system permease protein
MKTFKDIGLLYKRNFIEALRNGIWVVVGISTPLLYLALFTPLLQKLVGAPGFTTGNALNIFLPGILAFLAFGSGNGPGYSTIYELMEGTVERFRVTPVSRLALLLGPILSNITWLFIFVVCLVLMALPFGFAPDITGLLVSFVLLALILAIMSCFTISIALLTKEISTLAAITNGINLPILLLSGVLLPLSLAPEWENILAHFNPLYYVVEANRVLVSGKIFDGAVGLAFLVTIGLTVLCLWWATRVYKRAVA